MTRGHGSAAEIRAGLDHPVIDSDGHLIEFLPAVMSYLVEVAGQQAATRYGEWMRQNHAPTAERLRDQRIPFGGDRHRIAIGASHAFTDSLSADLGLAYAFFQDRRIPLSGASPENTFRGSLNADIEACAVAVLLGLRYRF